MQESAVPADLMDWVNQGRWHELASHLNVLSEDDFSPQTWLAKGLLLAYGPAEQRKAPQAIVCVEQACSLDPDEPRFWNTLSELYLQSAQQMKALEAAQKARNLNPENGMSAIAMARAAVSCGDRVTAYHCYQDALRLTPEDSPVRQQIKSQVFKVLPVWWQKLEGNNISLVRMGPEHFDFIAQCRNDTTFQHHYNLFQKTSEDAIRHDLKKSQRSPVEINKIEWIVKKGSKPVGLAALVDLNLKNSRAELLVGFPGETSGMVSVEATLLVLEYAFSVIGLHKVYSYVYSDNPVGQRNTLHLGFEQEGLLKEHVMDPGSGQRLSLHVNACFPEIFYSNKRLMKMAQRLLGRLPQAGNELLK